MLKVTVIFIHTTCILQQWFCQLTFVFAFRIFNFRSDSCSKLNTLINFRKYFSSYSIGKWPLYWTDLVENKTLVTVVLAHKFHLSYSLFQYICLFLVVEIVLFLKMSWFGANRVNDLSIIRASGDNILNLGATRMRLLRVP